MEIHISVQITELLTGSATTEGKGSLYFEGVVGTASRALDPHGSSGAPKRNP